MSRANGYAGCMIYARMSAADIDRARKLARGDMERLDALIAEKVTAHVSDCRKYADDEGWPVLAVYTDNMVSGNSRHRKKSDRLTGREALLQDLRERAGQRIIVLSTEVERLYRDVDESRELVEMARRTHITVRDTDESEYDLTTVEGESRFNGAVDKAQRESGKIGKRRRNQERRRAESGGYWGNEPFGYHKVYEYDAAKGKRFYTGRLELCTGSCCPAAGWKPDDWLRWRETQPGAARPSSLADVPPCTHHGNGCWLDPAREWQPTPAFFDELTRDEGDSDQAGEDDGFSAPMGEAEWIRVYAEAIVRGASLSGITRQWEAMGLTTRNGDRWKQLDIRRMFLNKRLAGIRVHRAGDKWGRAPRTAEGTETRGQWPAILDDELFAAVRGVLTNPDRYKHLTPGPHRGVVVHMLSGLAVCGNVLGPEYGIRAGQVCGTKMRGHQAPRSFQCATCGVSVSKHAACRRGHPAPPEGHPRERGAPTRQYACMKTHGGCGHCRRQADTAEAWVTEHVLRWTAPGGPYGEFVARERALHDAGRAAVAAELAAIEDELASLRGERERVESALQRAIRAGHIEAGDDGWKSYQGTKRQIDDDQAERTARRSKLLASTPPASPDDLRADLAMLTDPEAPVTVKAEIVRRFVARVIFRPPGQGTRKVLDPSTILVEPGPWADEFTREELAIPRPPGMRTRHVSADVLDYVAAHPGATAREAAEGCGISHSFASTVLVRLLKAGEVTRRRGSGTATPAQWALPGAAMPEAPEFRPGPKPGVKPKGEQARKAITAYLAAHPGATTGEIAAAIGCRANHASYVLTMMRDDGQVIPSRTAGGGGPAIRYTLPG